jgi:hypothetical protein
MFKQFEEWSRTSVLALAALAAIGCGGGGQQSGGESATQGESGSASVASTVDPATAATISGSVMFQGTAPEATMIDMSDETVCADRHGSAGKSTEHVVVNPNGTLANVFIYVKDGLGDMTFPVPQDPVVIDQAGCWYVPRVLGVQVGQDLMIKNSDGVLHNINAKPSENRGFNISQPVVMETTRSFRVPEVMVPLECDVHGWMQAYVGVLEHPYYSVTGEGGNYSLSPLPPGTYVIEAWHEQYGTQTQTITVGEGEQAEISFTFGEAAA